MRAVSGPDCALPDDGERRLAVLAADAHADTVGAGEARGVHRHAGRIREWRDGCIAVRLAVEVSARRVMPRPCARVRSDIGRRSGKQG
ncbi:hypothetical protein GCM10027564_19000 [Luteimonas notoginsengisoli]